MCGNWIAQVLVENHTIEKKEQEIYTYIFDYIISNTIYAFSLILIGVLCAGLSVVEGCFWFGEKNLYYAAISICVIIELIGLLAGIVKNRRTL